jgi:ABC-type multidrug transport system fused ATPase/permease subunit
MKNIFNFELSRYWKTFFEYGFENSIYNFILSNPTMFISIPIKIIINYLSFISYINIINNKNVNIYDIAIVIFSGNLNVLVERVVKKYSDEYKYAILNKIYKKTCHQIMNSSFENKDDIDIKYHFNTITQFVWSYYGVTDQVFGIIIGLAGSIMTYWQIIFIDGTIIYIILGCIIIYGYCLKFFDIERTFLRDVREKLYYDLMFDRLFDENPIMKSDYHEDSHPATMIDMLKHNDNRRKKYSDSGDSIKLINDVLIFIMIVYSICINNYTLSIYLLMNMKRIFEIADLYDRIRNIEINNTKSTDAMFEILDKITKCKDNKVMIRSKINIKKIEFDSMNIIIDDINIVKNHTVINANTIIILDGSSGCGKSLTIKYLSGLYSKSVFQNMKIYDAYGINYDSEFSSLISNRIMINQTLSDDFMYNKCIGCTFAMMFPKISYTILHEKLQNVYRLNVEKFKSIDQKISDVFPKPSGGEKQRLTIASMIENIMYYKPSYIILDEIDRVLDIDTAGRIMKYILDNYHGIVFIVSHLPNIKEMIMSKTNSQIWKFTKSNHDNITYIT